MKNLEMKIIEQAHRIVKTADWLCDNSPEDLLDAYDDMVQESFATYVTLHSFWEIEITAQRKGEDQ